MSDRTFDARWVRALTLEERRALILTAYPAPPFNAPLAEKRLAGWCAQPPFSDPEILRQRLAVDGLSVEAFARILGTSDADLLALCEPEPVWFATLRASFDAPEHEPIRPQAIGANPSIGLLHLVTPIIGMYRRRLAEHLQQASLRCPALFGELSGIERSLCEPFVDRFIKIIRRVLVHELSRLREAGVLEGATSQARYTDFLEKLRSRDFSWSILRNHSPLARSLIAYSDAWLSAQRELLDRLVFDLHRLPDALGLSLLGHLVRMTVGAGDRHCGGRSVTILHFSTGQSVVYKPRPVDVEAWFGQLAEALSVHCAGEALSTLRVLDCGDYGWVEYLPVRSCSSEAEVERFYRRLGVLSAVLYALDASDVHYENLIASGDSPWVVDLECLFSAPLRGESVGASSWQTLDCSVLKTGIFPTDSAIQGGPETSALSDAGKAMTFLHAGSFALKGQDTMHLSQQPRSMKPGRNRPQLRAGPVNVHRYRGALTHGFQQGYRAILLLRDELLAPGGLLDNAEKLEVRVLLRMTLGYSYLLGQSEYPEVLRDGLDLDRHWDALWIGIQHQPTIAPLFLAERRALRRHDVPLFTALAGGTRLRAERQRELDAHLAHSGVDGCRAKLRQLSASDCALQSWIIEASLATIQHEPPPPHHHSVEAKSPQDLSGRCRTLARAIGHRLQRDAHIHAGKAGWLGLCSGHTGDLALRPLGADLYSGIAGVYLFVGALAADTGDPELLALLKQTRAALLEHTRDGPPGAFDGRAGIAYALCCVAERFGDGNTIELAEEMCGALFEARHSGPHDLLSGLAGLIPILLRVARACHNPALIEQALAIGDRLVAAGRPQYAGGVAWQTSDSPALTGFSHGAAGIGWALLRLGHATGEHRFVECARRAFAYERAVFRSDLLFWPDYRVVGSPSEEMVAWCNGSVGIGLSRIEAQRLDSDPRHLRDIETALSNARQHGFGRDHSLCHGDTGTLVLLHAAGLTDEATALSVGVLDTIERFGVISGVSTGVWTPGLMTGACGVGLFFLSVATGEPLAPCLTLD